MSQPAATSAAEADAQGHSSAVDLSSDSDDSDFLPFVPDTPENSDAEGDISSSDGFSDADADEGMVESRSVKATDKELGNLFVHLTFNRLLKLFNELKCN